MLKLLALCVIALTLLVSGNGKHGQGGNHLSGNNNGNRAGGRHPHGHEVIWTYIGTGDMKNCGWDKIGTAGSLAEAQKLMLNNRKCAKEGATLFYSDYSYSESWSVRCGTSDMVIAACKSSGNPNWKQYKLSFKGPAPKVKPTPAKVKWTYIGTGDMMNCGWDKIGTAGSLAEAQKLMLTNRKCAKEGAILFYSDYSYSESWSVRCGTSEMVIAACKSSDNPNWKQYKLSFEVEVKPKPTKIKWTYIGTGDMKDCGWDKIGTAGSLSEAQKLMLRTRKCAKEGAILFYSDYSYSESWSVRCGASEMVTDACKSSDNPNWKQYKLSFEVPRPEVKPTSTKNHGPHGKGPHKGKGHEGKGPNNGKGHKGKSPNKEDKREEDDVEEESEEPLEDDEDEEQVNPIEEDDEVEEPEKPVDEDVDEEESEEDDEEEKPEEPVDEDVDEEEPEDPVEEEDEEEKPEEPVEEDDEDVVTLPELPDLAGLLG